MANSIQVVAFSPTNIASGDTISVDLLYSADDDGFVVVNEGANFDAIPGKIPIEAGDDLRKTVKLEITRQPNSSNQQCSIMFTLGASSFTILVGIQ